MKNFFFILLFSLISFNCQKEISLENGLGGTTSVLPTISTATITSITNTTAISGGNITSDGGATVTARGVCWSTSANPNVSGNHTSDGSGTGIFTSNITGLNASTIYYLRAYATNTAGTAYGNELTFTTSATAALATITTTAIALISTTTASSGGNVISDGGAAITARGICWGTTANPVATGNHTTDGTGTGTFTGAITGLTPATLYHVRAYATNSVGIAYGADISFTSSALSPDIYVVGYEESATNDVARLWKNGVATALTNGTGNGNANSVFVSGTDVYIVGEEEVGVNVIPKLWKNGVATNLSTGAM
ncbi:MAG: hypothetical protein RIS73_337, partial [Bacteroidota bacterium]